MKPCLKYREQIATMAINALEIRSELSAHLGSCAECRSYLEDISNVAGNLRAGMPQSDAQPSPSFHRNVVAAVEVAKRRSTVEAVSEQTSISLELAVLYSCRCNGSHGGCGVADSGSTRRRSIAHYHATQVVSIPQTKGRP